MRASGPLPVCTAHSAPTFFTRRSPSQRSAGSNPGAATPESLHRLYKNQAAATANPYTLRQFSSKARHGLVPRSIGFGSMLSKVSSAPSPETHNRREAGKRCSSPPRQSFRYVSLGAGHQPDSALLLKR